MKNGRLLDRVSAEEIEPPAKPETDTDILGRSRHLSDPVKLGVGGGLWLSHKLVVKPEIEPDHDEFIASVFEFRLFLTDDEDRVKWKFDLTDTGYEICYRPYIDTCRYLAPFLYVLVCEPRTTKMWRGIELILQGRDPREAWIYTQRLCGV